jgi:hypothetical protein
VHDCHSDAQQKPTETATQTTAGNAMQTVIIVWVTFLLGSSIPIIYDFTRKQPPIINPKDHAYKPQDQ